MPISLFDNQFLTIEEAAAWLPSRPHKNTVLRWCDRGYKGVRLESWRIGGRRITSIQALEDFVNETTRLSQPRNQFEFRGHQQAEAELDSMGVTNPNPAKQQSRKRFSNRRCQGE